jgi:hypothetical protein
MGKRGPEAKGEYSSRGATLSARLTTDTLNRLRAEAEANGVSISRELEVRLIQSFDERKADKDYGGPTTSALLRAIAEAFSRISIQASVVESNPGSEADIKDIEKAAKAKNRGWWNDRYIFDECQVFLATFFTKFRPGGRRAVPSHLRGYALGERWAAITASQLEMIAAGLPAPPHAKALAAILLPKMDEP